MVIYWKISGNELQVWVHDSDPSSDSPDRTASREFGVSVDFPPEVLDLARLEFDEAISNRDNIRALRIMRDAGFENIERI